MPYFPSLQSHCQADRARLGDVADGGGYYHAPAFQVSVTYRSRDGRGLFWLPPRCIIASLFLGLLAKTKV